MKYNAGKEVGTNHDLFGHFGFTVWLTSHFVSPMKQVEKMRPSQSTHWSPTALDISL